MTAATVVQAGRDFFVASSSREGVWYRIKLDVGACSCPAGRHGNRSCRHVAAALDHVQPRPPLHAVADDDPDLFVDVTGGGRP